jgi:hypothetical protein
MRIGRSTARKRGRARLVRAASKREIFFMEYRF